MDKVAIVTGISGQDGSYLAEQLLSKNYKVYGLLRRSSKGSDLGNSKHLEEDIEIFEGDLLDSTSLNKLCNLVKPDLMFSMASQSHVGSSFIQPQYTAQCTGIGVLNCLEAIRQSGIHTRFLQASSSEMFGGQHKKPCNEESSFNPRSPYAAAKLFAHNIVEIYRSAYKMFACSSICYNHESPRRSDTFVTRKITKAVAKIKSKKQDKLYLGNLEAKRDWGYAPDFTLGMIKMLTESPEPKDYVLGTGESHSVREFCEIAFNYAGLDYRDYVKIDPMFYRPAEVDVLIADYSKIKNDLGWEPKIKFKELVELMTDHDFFLEKAV